MAAEWQRRRAYALRYRLSAPQAAVYAHRGRDARARDRSQQLEFRGFDARPDLRVLLFTAALAVLSVCSFGLVPAFAATRGTLLPRLRETPSAGGRTRMQGAFVIAQLSLSLVLLLAGGLSLRALQKRWAEPRR